MEVNDYQQLFGCQHSSKISSFVFNRRNKLVQVSNLRVSKLQFFFIYLFIWVNYPFKNDDKNLK